MPGTGTFYPCLVYMMFYYAYRIYFDCVYFFAGCDLWEGREDRAREVLPLFCPTVFEKNRSEDRTSVLLRDGFRKAIPIQ